MRFRRHTLAGKFGPALRFDWAQDRRVDRGPEAESWIPVQGERLGTLKTLVSFVYYDGARMDVPCTLATED